MQFRHEVKHEISSLDMYILRQRLKAVMTPDSHARDGQYEICSLYFDNPEDKALRQKLDGVSIREKYRIRLYNNDPSVIHLERKIRHGGLGCKESAPLTPGQALAIVNGDSRWMAASTDQVILGFYTRIRNEGDCSLYPPAICIWPRKCPRYPGLQHSDRASLHRFPEPGLHHCPCSGFSLYP